jgi:hypothetical protein
VSDAPRDTEPAWRGWLTASRHAARSALAGKIFAAAVPVLQAREKEHSAIGARAPPGDVGAEELKIAGRRVLVRRSLHETIADQILENTGGRRSSRLHGASSFHTSSLVVVRPPAFVSKVPNVSPS